jgi:hypothetical protein
MAPAGRVPSPAPDVCRPLSERGGLSARTGGHVLSCANGRDSTPETHSHPVSAPTRCSVKTLAAAQTRSHSPLTLATPRKTKRRNPIVCLISAKGLSPWVLRCAYCARAQDPHPRRRHRARRPPPRSARPSAPRSARSRRRDAPPPPPSDRGSSPCDATCSLESCSHRSPPARASPAPHPGRSAPSGEIPPQSPPGAAPENGSRPIGRCGGPCSSYAPRPPRRSTKDARRGLE